MSGSGNGGLPDIGRHPAYMNVYDEQVFNDAGLTPLSVLNDRFGTNYAALIADAQRLDGGLDDSQWNILMVKAEIGGRMTLAKLMKTYGGKRDVAKDFGKHADTANRWEKLYKALPWATPVMRAEAAAAIANGEEYTYSIERVIKVGTDEAIRRGATEAPKPKYSGIGQVLLMDPTTATTALTDLPATFVNTKRQKPYWEEEPTIKLAAGVLVWVEKESDAKGYFSYEFPEPVGKRYFRNQRVLIARITKQNVVLDLGFTNLDHALNSADFHARDPKEVKVFAVDPEAGKLTRDFKVNDNDYLDKGDTIETPLSGILAGLTLVQDEPKSRHVFSLFDKRYSGRALIVRFERTSRWLAPLATSVSAGDLLQHVSWITLDAVNKAAQITPVADPNEGFEELDDAKAQDYLGCDMAHIRDYAIREWGTGDGQAHLRQHDMLREVANPDEKDNPVTLIYHVTKIRGIVNKWRSLDEGKARIEAEAKAKVEADGFRNLGSVEAHNLFGPRPELDNRVRQIFGLPLNEGGLEANGEVDDLLEKAGCFRIVAGSQYWHVEKLQALLNPTPVIYPWRSMDDLPLVGAILPLPEPEATSEPVETTTEPVAPTEPVEATTERVTPTEPVEATSEPVTPTEPVEATSEPVTPTEPVEATTEPVEATTEPVEATTEPVEATTEPVDDEPEAVDEEVIDEPVAAKAATVTVKPVTAKPKPDTEAKMLQKRADLAMALAEVNLMITMRMRKAAQIPDTVPLMAIGRALEDGDIYHMTPQDQVRALRIALGLAPLEPEAAQLPVEEPDDDDPPYAKLPYGERELTDRKLQDAMHGLVHQADREAIRTLTNVLGPNKALLGGSADVQRDRVKQLADALDKVMSIVRGIEPLIAEAFDHLDVAKSERTPRFDEIIAFYANVRGGEQRILWRKPEGEPKVDVLAYVVKTATKGEITLPTMPNEGDQPSVH